MVVEDLAIDLEQLRRYRAHGGRGRYLEAGFHVLDDAGSRAAQRLRRLTREHDRRFPIVGNRSRCRFLDRLLLDRRRFRGWCLRRRRLDGRGRRDGRCTAELVVGEEVAPALRHGLRVVLEQAEHLVDHARVRAEIRAVGRRGVAHAGVSLPAVGGWVIGGRGRRVGTRGRVPGGRSAGGRNGSRSAIRDPRRALRRRRPGTP